jgi:hypothetical protein
MRRTPETAQRSGAVAPFAALLLTLILALVAFAVDIGWVVTARTQLQAAADAAALAGADPLMDGYVQYQIAGAAGLSTTQLLILNNTLNTARSRAKQYASYNSAGDVHSLALNDSDIQFGFTDSYGNYTPYSPGGPFPNTIKVVLRRDSSANGPLGLFFAPVLGTRTVNLGAGAAAVITGGTAVSLQSVNGLPIGVLPVTYDRNAWNNFVQTGRWPNGMISLDANGIPQLQVYPFIQDVGNFGILSLDDSHIGASTIDGWIQNGIGPAQIAALTAAGLIPLSAHNPNLWNWLGDTGFKSDNVQTMNSNVGRTFILPLFTPYSTDTSPGGYQAGVGTGSGYNYNIVQFVGVRIVQPPNANRQVYLQPAAVLDPALVFNPAPAPVDTRQGGASLVTLFSYPRLSQ